jgi:nickel-dependent lactate racemase
MDLADFGLPQGVPVCFNRHAVEADEICIVGPVLPHEVVGCSGGYKYLTPGVGANELTGLTHWLGAVLTIPGVIGVVETPVRKLIEHCGRMIGPPAVYCAAFVVDDEELKCQFFGSPIGAHRLAAAETLRHNVEYTGRRFPRVVGCLAERYDELWTGGKASYKLIQLVEPGGELIIYAPHLREVSATWGDQITKIGYHSLEFIRAHLRQYLAEGISPGVLAHVTHVFGPGSFQNGVETPSVVHLAAGFSESFTRDSLNLGYRRPESLNFAELQSDPDTYVSNNAGQRLVLPASG